MSSHLSERTLGLSRAADTLSWGAGASGRKTELGRRSIWADLYMETTVPVCVFHTNNLQQRTVQRKDRNVLVEVPADGWSHSGGRTWRLSLCGGRPEAADTGTAAQYEASRRARKQLDIHGKDLSV
ncbi:hypothetical protein JOB18_025074 [Solea senegalensis]|uniref:Uncharacterized protein n=1 Tax=Solea senegalensis TaxID=28829 RepID=A0AAV6Q2I8_SOLSE|nr:hypothetical protein JOB18_025074 [Solea senegalensis]